MSPRLSRRALMAAAPACLLGCRAAEPGPPPAASTEARSLALVVPASPTMEGAGVRLGRTLGSRALTELDPFLMLDEIRSSDPGDYARGFPDHPHRGFETVTIMIDGAMEHRDSVGNRGLLEAGSVQWMTAGRGIIHSEMPRQSEGLLWGFQLWVNLPRRLKMTPPRYQDIRPDRVPEVAVGGSAVRLLAGAAGGERGPVSDIAVAPTLLDVRVPAGAVFEHELAPADAAFLYVLSGDAQVGADGRQLVARELGALGPGAVVRASAGRDGARFLLVSAAPIGEPVARRGPFVMSTQAELDQAYADYRAGRLVDG